MARCKTCLSAIGLNGMANCGQIGRPCERDVGRFNRELAETQRAITPDVLSMMESNLMPDQFKPTRAGFVAMAQLLSKALRQNEELLLVIGKDADKLDETMRRMTGGEGLV